ncbi:MAG: translocation/assembly module TamB domain-containing protein [Nitrospirota bacterium]
MKDSKKLKRLFYLLFFAILFGLIIFVSRGPYVSNTLKKLILPELEAASGQRVIAQKIYINLFPLFIEAKRVKLFDESGNRIIFADRVKGYPELSGVLNRQLSFRRLVIRRPDISSNREQVEKIIENVKAYLEKERKPFFRVKIKVVEITEATASLRDNESRSLIVMKGLGGEMILGKEQRLKTSIKGLDIRREGWPELTGNVNADFLFRKDEIEIKRLQIGSLGSRLQGSGFYSRGKGTLKTEIDLLVESVKRIFNLKQRGKGRISAKGEVRLGNQESRIQVPKLGDIFVDLKLKGDFYIQILIELLKVKGRVEGIVDFSGEMKGRLSDISGIARARLKKGNLFDIDVDSLTCDVVYQKDLMTFRNGKAELYNGEALAEASLNLPEADFYTLNVKFKSIDSKAALKLIGWEPEIPVGKVEGELSTSGTEFNPRGWFVYSAPGLPSKPAPEDVLTRIKDIKGSYSVRNNILYLSDLKLSTSLSNLNVEGRVNLLEKTLNLRSRLETRDISDLTVPYYREIKGRGDMSGEITGTFQNPQFSGKAALSDTSIKEYKLGNVSSDFSYNKNLLHVHELSVISPEEEYRLKGKIYFPEAEKPFELSKPVYEMNASLKRAELKKVLDVLYKDLSSTGKLEADFNIRGKDKDIELDGNARIERLEVDKIPLDSVSMAFSYANEELSFRNTLVKRGKSILRAEGRFSSKGEFYYKASSDRILIRDIGLRDVPVDGLLSIQSEGQGTLDNPVVKMRTRVVESTFKGVPLGLSIIDADIKNRDISLKALLFDEKVKLNGTGLLDEKLPWSAQVEILPGRYDFIFGSILKEVPEDLQFNLRGHADLKGDRRNITATVDIDQMRLTLFGYNFSNDSNIKILVNNKKLSIQPLSLRSDSTSLRLRGSLEIGKEYDLLLDGSSSLSPLKGLSKKISLFRGDADFVFSIEGRWERPEINGGMNIVNGSFGLRDYYQHVSSINGYIYMDKDRIVVQRLSGKIGGGDIDVTGTVYLSAFKIKRFYLEADLSNISISVSKDFSLNLGGDLVYKGTADSQDISGDIKINRARYRERVEWEKWLFARAKERPKAEVSKFGMTELNIKVSGRENIYIDNNIARAPVTVDTVIRSTISRPVLLGRLESREGIVYFRNNEFRISHASADFVDPNRINPYIELRAEANVGGYNIKLNLEGQLAHFTLSLSSEPPLEEMDILALLTVGQVGKQLKGLEGGIGAREATSFLTGRLQEVFEERLRTITGFERIRIEPYVSRTTGTVGSMVTISKRFADDRLLVTYSTYVGAPELYIIKLEYLLSKKVSLVGIRDELGGLGGDIKFRFEFK